MNNFQMINNKRLHEKEKYKALLKNRPSYGGTNHGRNATSIVRKWLKTIDQPIVADFGCGNNDFLKSIYVKKGIGIDFVNPGANLIEPMHKVSIETDTVDIVTSFDALEHLLPEEIDEVFIEMNRVAKSGGYFIFSISHVPSVITSLGENLHMTVEPEEWWIDKLEDYGTKISKERHYTTGRWM